MTRPAPTPRGRDSAPQPGALEWAGVVLLTLCAMLLGLLELFLVPLRSGKVLIPVAVVLAIAGNVIVPALARSLVQRALGAVLPFLGWLAVAIAIGLVSRPEGDVILPGGGYVAWVGYGVLLGGAVAGTIAMVLSGPSSAVHR